MPFLIGCGEACNMLFQSLSRQSLVQMAFLAIGRGFRSPSQTMLVLVQLGGPHLDLSFTPTYNKLLVLPTTGIVFAAISSKKRFVEWHAARGGWVSYANDFPASWLGNDLIIGCSTSVLIKKGVVDEIGVTTPVRKGKKK